jgi:putative SOS response-associated peptidase YedK
MNRHAAAVLMQSLHLVDLCGVRQHSAPMCNHYQKHPEAIQTWAEYVGWAHDYSPFSETGRVLDAWPKRLAPVMRRGEDGALALEEMRWGVPLTLPGKRPGTTVTKQVTNVRNLESPFWRGMLVKPEQRCLVPFTRFAEPVAGGGRAEHWFSVKDSAVAAFAGVWRIAAPAAQPGLDFGDAGSGAEPEPEKVFAFLTCEPNPLIAPLHPKAMPVILHPEDYQTWLSAEWSEAKALVQPFPSQLMGVE